MAEPFGKGGTASAAGRPCAAVGDLAMPVRRRRPFVAEAGPRPVLDRAFGDCSAPFVHTGSCWAVPGCTSFDFENTMTTFTRTANRAANQLRPVRITRHYTMHAEGSVLIEFGNTKVLCTASVEE